MKHLKKILVAVLLVAVLASSVVTIVMANSYTGDLDTALDLYKGYEDAEASSSKSLEDAKAQALADVYVYLKDFPIDPTSEGYDAFIEKYNDATVRVAYRYAQSCYAAEDTDVKAGIMTNLFVHLAAAPLFDCNDFEIGTAYKCDNDGCDTVTSLVGDQFYLGIPDDAVCLDGCDSDTQKIVFANKVKYSDLYKQIHILNIDVMDLVANKLYDKVKDAEKEANYLDLIATKAALAEFLENYLDLTVALPESTVYTGSISVVEAKMSALNEDGTFEEIRNGLADIYSYLILNPVSPASENYSNFYASYNSLCDKLMVLFAEKVNAATSPEEKIAIFNEMYVFLAGKEDDPQTVEVETQAPMFISERVVNSYNAFRDSIIGEYDDIAIGVNGSALFEEEIPSITYNVSDLTTFKSNVDATLKMMPPIKANPVFNQINANFRTKIYRYLTTAATNKIDPTLQGYAEVIEDCKYIFEYMVQHYADGVNNAEKLSDKYTQLQAFCTFIKTYPVSSEAIAIYNQARLDVLGEYKKFYDGVGGEDINANLPEFTPYDEVKTNIRFETLDNLLSDVEGAYAEYNAAANEDKGAAFEAWGNAIAALYSCLRAASINPSESFLASFSSEYDTLRNDFIDEYLAKVDAEADIALKSALLAEVKAFLAKYPLSKAAIVAYNAKVDEVFEGDDAKIASEKLDSFYFTLDSTLAAVNGAPTSITSAEVAITSASGDVASKQAALKTAEDALNTANAEIAALDQQIKDAVENSEDELIIDGYRTQLEEKMASIATLEANITSAQEALTLSEQTLEGAKAALDIAYTKFLADAKALQEYYEDMLYGKDVTDPAYSEFMTNFDVASNVITNVICDDVNTAINGTDMELAASKIQAYAAYLKGVNSEKCIEEFSNIVKNTVNGIKNKINYIENNSSEVAYYVSVFESIDDKMDEYIAAQTYDEKSALFKEIYGMISDIQITIHMIDGAYSTMMSKYAEIGEDFEKHVIATLSGHTDAKAEYAALMAVKDFLDSYNYSEAISEAYNAKLTELKANNLDEIKILVNDGTFNVTYASAENTTSDFSVFGTIVSGSGVNVSEFVSYFSKLSGKESGALALDFADADFGAVVDEYTAAIDSYSKYIEDEHKKILDMMDGAEPASSEAKNEAMIKLLGAILADVEDISVPTKIANAYSEVKDDVVYYYRSVVKSTFVKYKYVVSQIHDYAEKCQPDIYALDRAARDKYNNSVKVKIEGAEYGEAFGYIFDFDNAVGNIPTITKNQAYQKIQRYAEIYTLDESFSEKILADVILSDLFGRFIDEFDESVATLSPEDKQKAVDDLAYYLSYKKFPASLVKVFEDKYSVDVDVTAASKPSGVGSFDGLSPYVESFLEKTELNDMKSAIAVVVAYLNENPMSTKNLYDDVTSAITRMRTNIVVAIEEQKELSQKNANLADYGLAPSLVCDMENGKPFTTSIPNNSDKNASVSVKTEGSNTYAEFKYGPLSNTQYFNVTGFDSSTNFVVEMDIMSPEVISSFTLSFTEWGIVNTTTRVTSTAFAIADGKIKYIMGDYSNNRNDIEFPNYKEGVDEPIELIPGEWMHIAFAIDIEKFEIELIVDYTSLGKKPLIVANGNVDDTCKFTELRFRAGKDDTYCYDNIRIYSGDSYRDDNRFANKSDSELFEFYVDYAADESNKPVNRTYAYYTAASLAAKATSDEHKKLFSNIDIDAILAEAQANYKAELNEIALPLKDGIINTTNYAQKQATIDAIEKYIKKNQTYMDQSSDWFGDINDLVVQAEVDIEWSKNLLEYVKHLPLFQRAPTLAALKKHQANANKYYELCNLDDAEYLKKANSDQAVIDVLAALKETADIENIIKDDVTKGDDIGRYHNIYMPDRIEKQMHLENAKKLVDCVDAIELLVPDKTGLTTEQYHNLILEKAQANVDYVNAYMVAMREVIVAGEYDTSYPGIEETLVIYGLLDDMFYTIVQEKHYALIEEQIARYKETDSFIERAGICTYIKNYIKANNVDILTQRGSLLNYTVSVYEAELVTYRSEYEAILAANTDTFISIVERMKAYTDYSDLKPLYTDAIDNYYYNMNVDSDRAKAAIETFAVYEEMIQNWELSSKLFIDYSKNLESARRPAQIYRALVNCAKYVDGANKGVAGVTEALEIYNTKLAAYNESIAATNSEVSASMDIVCSVRTNVVAATVLAIIKNIFSK